MEKNSIPRTINYCWFGGAELSPLAKKCIASWKKYCPDFEIVRWDESNYPIENKCQFVQDAYKNKKWAFVSDYARLDIIYQNGGIYLDTDVEIIAPIEDLITKTNGRYFGWQDCRWVNSGLGFALSSHDALLKEMMLRYESISFESNSLANFTCPMINTEVLEQHGLVLNGKMQYIQNVYILPPEFLCPINLSTGIKSLTRNTISIHHYDGSWMEKHERTRMKLFISIKKVLPQSVTMIIKKLAHRCQLGNVNEE